MYTVIVTYNNLSGDNNIKTRILYATYEEASTQAIYLSEFVNVYYVDVIDMFTGEVINNYIGGEKNW